MGHPERPNHQSRLFGGISPPSAKMLPYSRRAGCTGMCRAWRTEILTLKYGCQCCYRAWRAATKPFLPCLSWGAALFRLAELGCVGSRGTWGAMGQTCRSPAWCPGPGAALPAESHSGYRRFSLLYAHCLQCRLPLRYSLLRFMPPNVGSHALGSLWPWVLRQPCRADVWDAPGAQV